MREKCRQIPFKFIIVFAILSFIVIAKGSNVLAADKGELTVSIEQITSQDSEVEVTTSLPSSHFVLVIGDDYYTGETDNQGIAVISFVSKAGGEEIYYPMGTTIDLIATNQGKHATASSLVLCRMPSVYSSLEGDNVIRGLADSNVSLQLDVEFAGGHYTLTTQSDDQGNYQFSLLKVLERGESIEVKAEYNGQYSTTGKYTIF